MRMRERSLTGLQHCLVDLSMFRKLSLGEPKAALVQILGGVEKVRKLNDDQNKIE